MASAFENRLRRTIEMAGTDGQAGPVPVMATLSDGGNAIAFGPGAPMTIPTANDRYRTMPPISEGTLIADPSNSPTAYFAANGSGASRYGFFDLPGGRRRVGVEYNVPGGNTSDASWEIPIGGRVFAPTDVLTYEFITPSGAQPRVYLGGLNIPIDAIRANSVNQYGLISYIRRTGLYTMSCSPSRMLTAGTVGIGDAMQRLRVSMFNSGARGTKSGFLRAWLNRKERPQIMWTTDDGLPENLWLADQLAARGMSMTAYIISSFIGQAGYMTLAELKTLAAKPNVQIASHSNGHMYPNGGLSVSGYKGTSTTDGVCLSQAVAAGAMTINPSPPAGLFTGARHLEFVTASAQAGISILISGIAGGRAVSETVYLGEANGYPYPSQYAYDSMPTSLVVSLNGIVAAGTITVGTSMSADEIGADLDASFKFQESNGLSRPADRHYCCPQGQYNKLLEAELLKRGVKTVRLTDVTTLRLSSEVDMYQLPACAIEEALAPNIALYLQLCQEFGESLILYLHQIKTDNSAPAAGGIRASTLTPLMDTAASFVAGNLADSPTLSLMYVKTNPVVFG